MLLRLLLLFTVVPLVELALLFWIAKQTDWVFTIALVIITGVVGASLARHEGLRCWTVAQQKIAHGELPTDSLLDGLMILLAGALLITPGVLTDLVGFALLIPPMRRVFRRRLAQRLRAHIIVGTSSAEPWGQGRDEIIDVRVIDAEPDESAEN